MTPKERFDQALKASLGDPYDILLSFSIDTNGVTTLQLHPDLLKDDAMFANFLTILRTELPTRSLQVLLQPHEDYNVEDRFTNLQDSLEDVEGIQVTQVPYEENGSSWKKTLIKGGIAGFVAAPFVVTAGVAALGFTATGIAAGSAAATIMSSYGGAVGAGSMCAVLQSIGAAGLSAAGTAVASTVGAVFGGVGAKVISSLANRNNSQSNDDDESDNNEDEEGEKIN